MIKMKPALLLLLLFLSMYSNAAVAPVAPAPSTFDPFKIKPSEIEKITGKKLTLFQKVKLTLAQKALRKYSSEEMTVKQRKQARLSMILGFLGIALLLLSSVVGAFAILCIPASILAIIFGAQSLKGNHNTEGILGVVSGGLTIAIIVLAIIVIIASGPFTFG
jgi:Na+/pantothenate symporter